MIVLINDYCYDRYDCIYHLFIYFTIEGQSVKLCNIFDA